MDGRVTSRAEPRGLWDGVDAVLGRAPRVEDVSTHQLGPLAARRLRALGHAVPERLLEEERRAAVVTLTAPVTLARVRAAHAGPLLVMKGPAVAVHYPDPALRPFKDLDLLAEDAAAAQRDLIAAGFVPVGDPALYDGIHHLRPLAWPGLPLTVEIHSEPKWIDGLPAPPTAELLDVASRHGRRLDGFLTLPPARHALLLAAHSWAHEPLRRLRDLVDVAALAQGLDRDELRRLAAGWRIEKAWEATIGAADALFLGEPRPWAIRIWARNLPEARERTVLENHLVRLLGGFWALPPSQAAGLLRASLGREIRPRPDESWNAKLSRTARAVRNALRRRSDHDREWLEAAKRRGGGDEGGRGA